MSNDHGRLSPAFRAAMEYQIIPGEYTFFDAVEAHLVNGYVVASPEMFILARPVERSASEELLLNPCYRFESPDAWFIYLAAGQLKYAWKFYPKAYEWVGWQRRGKVCRFYEMNQIKRKSYYGIETKSSTTTTTSSN